MTDRYPGGWPYTADKEEVIHARWIDQDPYGAMCGERSITDHHKALEGLRSARVDIMTLLREIDRLRASEVPRRRRRDSDVIKKGGKVPDNPPPPPRVQSTPPGPPRSSGVRHA